MQLEILTPDKSIFAGEAIAVNVPGILGSFEILAGHAALVSALGTGTLVIRHAKEEQSYQLDGGVVEVLNDKVTILAERISA